MAQDGAELFDYAQKVLPWLGPIWAELIENCEEFCPDLAQDGHNFWQHTKSSALAMPQMDKISAIINNFARVWLKMGETCDIMAKVLPWLDQRWAELLAIY